MPTEDLACDMPDRIGCCAALIRGGKADARRDVWHLLNSVTLLVGNMVFFDGCWCVVCPLSRVACAVCVLVTIPFVRSGVVSASVERQHVFRSYVHAGPA